VVFDESDGASIGQKRTGQQPGNEMTLERTVGLPLTNVPLNHRNLAAMVGDNAIHMSGRNGSFRNVVRIGAHQASVFVDSHVLFNELFGIQGNGIVGKRTSDKVRYFRGCSPVFHLLRGDPAAQNLSEHVAHLEIQMGRRS
jgi:hypothetical protein